MSTYSVTIRFPVGPITIRSDAYHILRISHSCGKCESYPTPPSPILNCIRQLKEYFRKQRTTFALNLKIEGTPFQKKVWNALQSIPYGEVASYSQIASIVNAPCAYRAVGAANNANPFSIVIPCHRVIGSGSDLVGYRGGLKKKSFLLKHENHQIKNFKVCR